MILSSGLFVHMFTLDGPQYWTSGLRSGARFDPKQSEQQPGSDRRVALIPDFSISRSRAAFSPATQASADSRDSARAAVRSTSQHGSSRRGRRRSRGDEVCLAGPLITAARPRARRAARETMLAFERVLLTWLSRGAVASYNRASRRYNDIQSERRR